MTDDHNILIGGKPFMNYVNAVVMQFINKGAQEVSIKARGKFITRAVDVAEVSSKRFLENNNVTIKDIFIDSTEFEQDSRKIRVSTIEIVLVKGD